ncbi:MAG: beta-ketoacyl-[acyl-carrier-protein] synthase family protein [Fimbriimonadaceae bacterium]|nr:beta-ketoacyl-[acyl-carrier-protein] synthase family protein [Fimbriimonadaceae bacterium]
MNDVVVTGLGAVSALGCGVEPLWRRLLAGDSGLRPLTRWPADGLRNRLAGEVDLAALPPAEQAPWRRFADLAVAEALAQAGYEPGAEVNMAAVVATNFGGQEAFWAAAEPGAAQRSGEFHQVAAALAAAGCAPTVTFSNACSSGTQALGHAADLVRLGLCDAALAVGVDELGLFCLSGLSILHTVSTDTIRPFDRQRSGTIFGEGAGALVVENAAFAAARGARPLASVLGYGVNNNAWHMTAPDKGGAGMVAAMRLALAQAEVAPQRIGHVNAHATGTEYHDPAETAAIKEVLGAHAYDVPVSAIKAATGHAMGAAGALEAVVTVLALQHQLAPPTLNLTDPDPACDLDCVPGVPRAASFEVALSISAGIGGNNAAVLLGRCA